MDNKIIVDEDKSSMDNIKATQNQIGKTTEVFFAARAYNAPIQFNMSYQEQDIKVYKNYNNDSKRTRC